MTIITLVRYISHKRHNIMKQTKFRLLTILATAKKKFPPHVSRPFQAHVAHYKSLLWITTYSLRPDKDEKMCKYSEIKELK